MFLSKTNTKLAKQKLAQLTEHTFTIEDAIKELPRSLQYTLTAWYGKFEDDNAASFALFNNISQMDQELRVHTVMSKKPIAALDEEMLSFFNQVSLQKVFTELMMLYKHAPYHIEDGQFHTLGGFEKKNNQLLTFISTDNATPPRMMSAQTFLLSRVLEAEMRRSLSKHVFTQYIAASEEPLFTKQMSTLEHMSVTEFLLSYENTASVLFYAIFTSQLERLLYDEFSEEPSFADVLTLHKTYKESIVSHLERSIGAANMQQLQSQLKSARTANKDKDAKIQKLKDELKKQKDLVKEARTAQKTVVETPSNKQEVLELQTKLKDAKDELDKQKRQFDMDLNTQEREVRKKKGEIEELKAERSALLKQLNDQKQVNEQASQLTIEQWMELGKPLLEQATLEDELQLEQYFTMFTQLLTDRRAKRRPQTTMNDLFGYYEPRDDGHYIVFANGDAHLIKKIPNPVYLRNQQFVRVNEQFELLENYHYCYYDAPLLVGCQFSIVEMVQDVPHIYSAGKLVPLRLKPTERALHGQIVAYTRTHELARYYMDKTSNLDDLAASIKLKKHELYHVQQLIGNGAVVIKPFTQEVLYKELPSHHNLKMYDTFTFHEGEILHVFGRHAFYESSEYYTKRQLATIHEIAEQCFIKKDNREVVILKYDPAHYTPTEGEVIYVDEHHRYLYRLESEANIEETIEQKMARSTLYEPKKEKVVFETRDVQGDKPAVTVVTRTDYFDSYRNRLSPYYDITLADGFGPLEKIKQAARKSEVVVLCTSHMSHTTRQNVYEAMPREKVIEDDSVGAQGIELRLMSYFK
ncbi:MAG: hypothetical protein UHX00_08605 [Caryophanon sp.]|nr:hypothetical protein [Caryophanon sp.]